MQIDIKYVTSTVLASACVMVITAFFNMDGRVNALEAGDKEDKRVNELVYALPEQLNRIETGVKNTDFKTTTIQMQLQYLQKNVESRLTSLENRKDSDG